jgi:hypothetical protein
MVFFVIIKSVEGKLGILVNVNIITKNGWRVHCMHQCVAGVREFWTVCAISPSGQTLASEVALESTRWPLCAWEGVWGTYLQFGSGGLFLSFSLSSILVRNPPIIQMSHSVWFFFNFDLCYLGCYLFYFLNNL